MVNKYASSWNIFNLGKQYRWLVLYNKFSGQLNGLFNGDLRLRSIIRLRSVCSVKLFPFSWIFYGKFVKNTFSMTAKNILQRLLLNWDSADGFLIDSREVVGLFVYKALYGARIKIWYKRTYKNRTGLAFGFTWYGFKDNNVSIFVLSHFILKFLKQISFGFLGN